MGERGGEGERWRGREVGRESGERTEDGTVYRARWSPVGRLNVLFIVNLEDREVVGGVGGEGE